MPNTPRYEVELVVADAGFAASMAFLPDGSLLYTDPTTYTVRAVGPEGVLSTAPFIDLSGRPPDQREVIGIAISPNFCAERTVFVSVSSSMATDPEAPPRTDIGQVLELRANGPCHRWRHAQRANASPLIADAEVREVFSIQGEVKRGYEAGNLHFGPDNLLYLAVGNRRPDDAAQERDGGVGRILRFTTDGEIPADNPLGPDNATFAYGLRNSYDFTFRGKQIFAADNGPAGDDELNRVEAGANYGWPIISGDVDTDEERGASTGAYTSPLAPLGPGPTGVAVDEHGVFGAPGGLLVGEWSSSRIVWFDLSPDGRTVLDSRVVAEGLPATPIDLAFHPDGSLWFTSPEGIYRLVGALAAG